MDFKDHYLNVHPNEVTLFAATNFRNQLRRFGIKTEDRRRHMYVLGKSGTGKTTLLENLMYQDIQNGHGLALVDPHGDFSEKIIGFVPEWRKNDVIYVNPADIEHPVGFNVLEWKKEEQKFLIGAGLMGVFKKIWPDVWSARMEHIMNNCILALLDYPNSTLLGINRLLSDKDYRRIVISAVKDPVVKSFWLHEFERWEPKFQKEAIAPIQNKVGQFLSSTLIRNIVAQTKSTFDIREAMDTGKIVVINLSKGRIGEDASRLLGGMLITKIQLAAMERVDMPEADRRDFYLYVDEFQNFATESFANILSEARKYRLNLIVAHQYIKQLEEEVADAVFGNVGSILTFRVGTDDATFMEAEFMPDFTPEDLVNIPNHQIYLKLLIDGVTSKPFSANTLPPLGKPSTELLDLIINTSRRLYSKNRAEVEKQIVQWSESYVDESRPVAAKPVAAAPVAIPHPPTPVAHAAPAFTKPTPVAHTPVKPPRIESVEVTLEPAKPNETVSLSALMKDAKPAKVESKAVAAPVKSSLPAKPVSHVKPALKVIPKGQNGEFGGKIRIVKDEAPAPAKPVPAPKPHVAHKPVPHEKTPAIAPKSPAPEPKKPETSAKSSQKSSNVFPW